MSHFPQSGLAASADEGVHDGDLVLRGEIFPLRLAVELFFFILGVLALFSAGSSKAIDGGDLAGLGGVLGGLTGAPGWGGM